MAFFYEYFKKLNGYKLSIRDCKIPPILCLL
ncbi:MAG: hypothetical protein H6Q48_3295 [Deltaproteobacteria bacterium]|nr:hypothetical protein [Deltaproteobacteria bacterium]